MTLIKLLVIQSIYQRDDIYILDLYITFVCRKTLIVLQIERNPGIPKHHRIFHSTHSQGCKLYQIKFAVHFLSAK
jgi:hypothetical protein